MTYTYALLPVSDAVYDEIMYLLQLAGYDHAISKDSTGRVVLDMHGIALARKDLRGPARPSAADRIGPARKGRTS